MSREKQFVIGQDLTYKSVKALDKGGYKHGGGNQGGFVGKLVEYLKYNYNEKCWDIVVTYREQDTTGISRGYTMLESEFEEFFDLYDELEEVRKLIKE